MFTLRISFTLPVKLLQSLHSPVLSDLQKRAIYDQYGEEGLKGQVPLPDSGGFPDAGNGGATFFTTGDGSNMFKFNPRNAEDVFSEFFGFSSPFRGMGGNGGRGGSRSFSGMFGGDGAEDISGGSRGDGRGMMNPGPRKGVPIEKSLPCRVTRPPRTAAPSSYHK